ncbi:MAG: GNVR domain-containing protein [Candidatus Krumholzibacteriia bacterium]
MGADVVRGLLQGAIRHRRSLAFCVAGGLLCALVAWLLLPPLYVARVTILPRQAPHSLPLLGTVNLPSSVLGDDAGALEVQYSRILKSDRLLDRLIESRWVAPGTVAARDLFAWLHADPGSGSPDQRLKAADDLRRRLRRWVVSFSRDQGSGFMELKVTVPRHAWLSAALADSLARELDAFNQVYRAGKAEDQARFIQARIVEAAAELRRTEDVLARFVAENRLYTQSFSQMQEFTRLSREVETLTSVWVELRRQLEMARIEANDRKLSLDILDSARTPPRKAWPQLSLLLVMGVVLGLVAWSACLLVGGLREQWSGDRPSASRMTRGL